LRIGTGVSVNAEARLGFWALAYLVRLHAGSAPEMAENIAEIALKDFEAKAEELGVGWEPSADTKEHS
jgi:hypothetical protein